MTEAISRPQSPGIFSAGWVLPAVMLGTFLSVLDSTILNVALPYVMAGFSSDVEHAKWIASGFFLGATVSMPLSGWLGNRFGSGPVYIIALSVFTLGAAFCSVAWSLNTLIALRVIQGVAAGFIQPTSIEILTRAYPPHMRGRVFGIWTIGLMTAPSLGPAAGGVIIEMVHWRAIFVLSAGVGVVAWLLAVAALDRDRGESVRPFDWPGYLALAVLLVSAFLTVTYGDQEGWSSAIIVAGMFTTAAALGLLIILEWDQPNAILPLRLFRYSDFSLAAFITVYRSIGLFSPIFLMPLFLFEVQGRESMDIGFMLMPGSVVMASASPLAGYLTDRIGGRWPTIFGFCMISIALFMYHDIDASMSTWRIVFPLLLQGIGIAFVMTPAMTTGMNAVSRHDAGHASWILNICQRGGGAFAITILGMLLSRRTMIQDSYFGTAAMMQQPATDVLKAAASRLGLTSTAADSAALAGALHHVRDAASSVAFGNIFLLASVVTATALIPSLFMSGHRPHEEQQSS